MAVSKTEPSTGADVLRGRVSDDELLGLVRGGDNEAYGILFARYARVGRHVARECAVSLEAEDIVDEAFTRILEAVHAGKGPKTAFRAYLMHTIRNIAVSQLRKQTFPATEDADLVPGPKTLEERVMDRWDAAAVAAAFEALPPRWQEILVRVDLDAEPTASVAAHLNLSRNTVAALTYRARCGLRTAIATPSEN